MRTSYSLWFLLLACFVFCLLSSAEAKKKKKQDKNESVNKQKLPGFDGPPGYPTCSDNLPRLNERCCRAVRKWWMERIRKDQMDGMYGHMIRSMRWEDEDSQEDTLGLGAVNEGKAARNKGRCTASVEFRPVPTVKSQEGCLATPYCTWFNSYSYQGGCTCGREHVKIVKLLKSMYTPIYPVLEDEVPSWDKNIRVGPNSKWTFLQRQLQKFRQN